MKRVGRGLGSCSVLIFAASALQAEESSAPALEEVVVTATKRSEALIDVPVALTAITADQIDTRGYTNYADYLNSVPNTWMQDIGPGLTQLYIRGLVAQGGSGFPVATYFGEAVTSVVSNGGGFANLRLVDIDRVEVLRGPQGTLFGANSLAGVVRIVPAAPNLSAFQASTDIRGWSTSQSDNLSEHVEGVLNLPIVNDKFALRLVAYQDYIAGYIDNVVPAAAPIDYSAGLGAPPGTLVIPGHDAFTRKDINSQDVWGARAAVTFQPVEQLRIDLSYLAQGVTLNSEPPVQPAVGPYEVERPLDLYERGKAEENERIGQLVINYDWSAATLTSATSYSQIERFASQDIGFLAAAAGLGPQLWALQNRSKGHALTEELRLQSRGPSPFQWLIGYYYSNAEFDLSQFVPDYSCPTCLPEVLFGQNYAITTIGSPIGQKQRQQSLFGEGSYDFGSMWTIGLGGRYLKDYIEAFSPAAQGLLVGGFQPASPPFGGDNSIFNPSAYLRFKPNADTMAYLQAARGFRSGTANQALSYDPNGPCGATAAALGIKPLSDPDKLWTYELGLKSAWLDKRIATNIAVFHQKWDGVQLATSQACGFNGVVNGGDASGNGAELEVTARLSAAWNANLSAAWVHNKFDSVTPGLGFAAGDRVPGAPEQNGSAGLQYNFAFGTSGWGGYARGDYVYVGPVHYVFGQGAGAASVVQGGYGQGNLRFAVQRDKLSIEIFGRNITDKRAAEATGNPTQNGYVYLIRPREVGLELRYAYDRAK